MDRTERFYKLHRLLDAKGTVRIAELLRELGVSRATFKRDLEYMRDRMNAPIAFDPGAGIVSSASLSDYSTASIGWFDGMRKEASNAADAKEALAVRTAEALSNETGVNVDMEMSLLLDLEHSYEASARLLRAVDDLYRDNAIHGQMWDALARELSERQLLDVLFTVGGYRSVSYALNSAGVQIGQDYDAVAMRAQLSF